MQFPILLLAEFYWKITPKAVHGISGNATGWISLENKSHVWTWNLGHGIPDNATAWISV
jgi:hypothetical protein